MNIDKKQLVRARAGHKAYVSNLLANFENCKKDPEYYIETLMNTRRKMEDLTDQIVTCSVTDQEANDEITKENEYMKRIHELIQKLQSEIKPRPSSSAVQTVGSHEDHHARLPILDLKQFSGNIQDWLPFWETYQSAIHDSIRLSSVEKSSQLLGGTSI